MIVAAGAGNGQAQESARNDIDSIVTLIGACHLNRAVVVIPRSETEKSRSREESCADPSESSKSPAICDLTN